MYCKDLVHKLFVRLSHDDYSFLVYLSLQRGQSLSECLRYILNEYKRDFVDHGGLKDD